MRKYILIAIPIALLAATKTATFTENASVVPGSSVSAYLIGDRLVTQVRSDDGRAPIALYGVPPVLQVRFPVERSWILVKHVTWDKPRHRITIDF